MRREFFEPIFLPGTPEEIEKAIPFIKASDWKPIVIPMLDMKDAKPFIITKEMAEVGKFRFLLPDKMV